MRVMKFGNTILGVNLTTTEKKALDLEIQRQLAEFDQKHEIEMEATVLWVLHERFGFGSKRLREFYEDFDKEIKRLLSRYEMEESDRVWLCTKKLKDLGIDLDEWRKESAS